MNVRVCVCVCVYLYMYIVCTCIGMNKDTAIQRYLEKVCDLEIYGTSYRGYYDDKYVRIDVGSRHVHITDLNHKTINRYIHTHCTSII